MMNELLYKSVLSSFLAVKNTTTALELLREGAFLFNGSIEGQSFYAEILYYAIKSGEVEVIQYLLNLKIFSDITFFKYCGHTPISLVIQEGKQHLVPLILAKTDKNFALHIAVMLGQERTKNLLLSNCAYTERFLAMLGLQAKNGKSKF
jgi:hypothetical protein